ncbi:hypothetical protein [Nodularia spumigena]|jgi:hypothetical protein|uniref:Uncharacterized protein n=1 Tax=Nodularia spumigena UHCC 0060 TaxID=3110300 RepID=A0ABU5UR95_NODSP|nr:hypothetical protein [Nodularia spumigena]MEA5525227.1 hypothetical protein [Nodularia spumigena UHCC 0143]MEA5607600.1 hypothetical protein [Nodularia spumigena UHCC 0060]MEA5611635.1 hypothetical protein [Nodularia spumigena UHCC 0040]
MTTDPNQNQSEDSPWNPFIPTKRDINRTEELAKKSPVVAGLLTFFITPAAMIYLNRGVNNLKILGYVFVIAFMLGLASYKENEENNTAKMEMIGNVVGFGGSIALITENVKAITLARKRLGFKQYP